MSTRSVEAAVATRELTIAQAVNEALAEELRRDEAVFVIGEDVAEAAREEMQAAVDFGLGSPPPEPEDATRYVYA